MAGETPSLLYRSVTSSGGQRDDMVIVNDGGMNWFVIYGLCLRHVFCDQKTFVSRFEISWVAIELSLPWPVNLLGITKILKLVYFHFRPWKAIVTVSLLWYLKNELLWIWEFKIVMLIFIRWNILIFCIQAISLWINKHWASEFTRWEDLSWKLAAALIDVTIVSSETDRHLGSAAGEVPVKLKERLEKSKAESQ